MTSTFLYPLDVLEIKSYPSFCFKTNVLSLLKGNFEQAIRVKQANVSLKATATLQQYAGLVGYFNIGIRRDACERGTCTHSRIPIETTCNFEVYFLC